MPEREELFETLEDALDLRVTPVELEHPGRVDGVAGEGGEDQDEVRRRSADADDTTRDRWLIRHGEPHVPVAHLCHRGRTTRSPSSRSPVRRGPARVARHLSHPRAPASHNPACTGRSCSGGASPFPYARRAAIHSRQRPEVFIRVNSASGEIDSRPAAFA